MSPSKGGYVISCLNSECNCISYNIYLYSRAYPGLKTDDKDSEIDLTNGDDDDDDDVDDAFAVVERKWLRQMEEYHWES